MARSTMSNLISRLRTLTATAIGDYTVGVETYWTDDYLQQILDTHRVDLYDEALHPVREVNSGGTAIWREYQSDYADLESTDGGTAVFFMRASTGTLAGTADWTANYNSGRVSFGSTTGGTVYYLTARTYDLNAAAAEVWDAKAANVADRYTFQADGGRFDVSKMVEQFERQANRFRALSRPKSSTFVRSDLDLSEWPNSGPKSTRVTY